MIEGKLENKIEHENNKKFYDPCQPDINFYCPNRPDLDFYDTHHPVLDSCSPNHSQNI